MRIPLFVAGFGLLAPYWLGNLFFVVPVALCIAVLLSYWKPWRCGLLLVLAFAYSSYQVQTQVQQQIRGCAEKLQARVTLEVQEVQPAGEMSTRLVGVVRTVLSKPEALQAKCQAKVKQRYRLTWRSAPTPAVGSVWQMDLVLSEPWGYQNPGGFDYERWLLGANLAATGYVRSGKLLSAAAPRQGLDAWRAKLAEELAGYSQAGVLQALVLGDVGKLDSQDWHRLRASGTVHLFIVSGLHVGLVASASFFVVSWWFRVFPWLVARVPARRLAVVAALVLSGLYVLLTGAKVPGVRAWIMLSMALTWVGFGRRGDLLLGFLWALVVILLCLPRSGWQLGFYLSFGAVGVLLWFFEPRYSAPKVAEVSSSSPSSVSCRVSCSVFWPRSLLAWLMGQLRLLLRVQIALLLGLGPLTVALGLASPSLGFLVNLVAVPWVSLAVVPLALVGSLITLISASIGHILLACANSALVLFQHLLEAASTGGLWQPPSMTWWAHGLHGVVGLLCLMPMAWRSRVLASLAYASILLNWQTLVPDGDFRILVLDVGQGSAILVSTAQHHLLFDAGPAYESGFNAAQALIEPTLGALGVRHLDGLVISHEDIDHSGGADPLRAHWQPKLNLQGGLLKSTEHSVKPCVAGQRWVWDQVEFELLSPPLQAEAQAGLTSNDASCVLQVTAMADRAGAAQQALLLGDISQPIELSLLESLTPGATFMTAPHHGSATSSSYALVRRLHPQWVVASTARHSRYGHPHPKVVRRYCSVGARLFVTGEAGAVSWRSDQPSHIRLARMEGRPWRQGQSQKALARCW